MMNNDQILYAGDHQSYLCYTAKKKIKDTDGFGVMNIATNEWQALIAESNEIRESKVNTNDGF